ncbi:histidine triad (HIT) protein [Desulfofarcimen acetoxidans DSM 771]|jgi:histidine triad (HIT) family protein|uniref:Histidine triad (HIT) protein n=1 Tax=Desulfofarcimen acetoxidans (strain ATCC 49208 / DSM 771 / KCTC 5769 / VKM B-1644 / 5575) TaxID=485916 RepID=C8W4S0_DESAS|nr:histidine triad nucleotide-binding protein [Desulfofarcimen acetoxidans]ACV63956.1 histidine triad (HIT) protein [Desulfofarcimen acetoxidans DSM 771]
MQDCVFCKIVKKEIPAEIIYEDNDIMVFVDVKPVAPIHLLFIPKKHIPTVMDLQEEDAVLVGKIQLVAAKLARDYNLEDRGYRLVTNCKRDAGQLVYHIHYHFLAGRPFQWPPG